MNDRLLEWLLRSEVRKLPEHKKRLYQFITEFEDNLVQEADTADEYLQLLTKHSPYAAASRHFMISAAKAAKFMNDIETELNERLEARCQKVRWIDCTDRFSDASSGNDRKQVFLLIN